jgi:tetratricopeptide (TPR) repeat protein
MNLRAMSWLVVLALAGCTGFGPGTLEASDEPTHVDPLPEGLIAEPIAPQSPTTAIQRYRVAELADDHGLTPGRFVGLYALEGRAVGLPVGVAEVVRSGEREAELAALWVDLERQRAPLAIGEPPARRFGAVLGNLTKRPGDSAPAHLDIGAVHGAQVGDLYAALSDDPTPRELGLLKVVALDDGARVVWLRGEAPLGARVRRVGHEAPRVAPARVLVARLAGDRGAEVGAALRDALGAVAAAADLRIEAVDVAVDDPAAAARLARERDADAVVWGSAGRKDAAVALRLGLAFADGRRTAEQLELGAPRATRTLADGADEFARHARQLAPLLAGWAVHSELEIRGGGASARAAGYFTDALASDDPQTVVDARARLLHCRRAMRDWAGAWRLAEAVEHDGETAGADARVRLGRLTRARLAAEAGALDSAEPLARALITRATEEKDRRGAADATLVLADVLRQRRDLADAQATLERAVVPAYAELGARRAEADALILLAAVHRERGTLHEAIALLRDRAAPLLDKLGEAGARARVDGELGVLHFRIGAVDEAEKLLRAAATALQRAGDVAGRTAALEQLAELQEERGEIDDALESYARELVPARARLGDLRGYARARQRVGEIRAQRGDPDGAMPELQAALRIFTRIADHRSAAQLRRWLAFVATTRGDYDQALKILRTEVLPVFSGPDDRSERAMTLKEIAHDEGVDDNPKAAIELLQQQVLPGLSGPGDIREHAIAKAYLAQFLAGEQRSDEAIRLFGEALVVFERVQLFIGVARVKYELASIRHDRGEYDRALRIYREVAPLFARIGDPISYGVVMGRIAEIHHVRGEHGDALKIRKQAESAGCERSGNERCRAIVLLGLAELAADDGKVEAALRTIDDEALPLLAALDDRFLLGQAHLHRADFLYRLGRTQAAKKELRDEALPRFVALGNDNSVAVTQSYLATIEEDEGRPEAALELLREQILPVHQRSGNRLNLMRTQVHIAGLLLTRDGPGDRQEATALLRKARTAARALKATDLADIDATAKEFGLDL